MQRCLQLAALGEGAVAPNPMVGAVLVHEEKIIGEGWHQQYGGPHAEVNCLASVLPQDQHLIPSSTLYVSLEPCSHFGKTPPCTNLVLESKIKTVVVGCTDAAAHVNGKGISILREAGVSVITPILEKECLHINRRFFCFHKNKRPFIILKWAQTQKQIIGDYKNRLLISSPQTNRLVHKWRSEEAGILVGNKTVLYDNPSLSNRYGSGAQPVRIVLDRTGILSGFHKVFDGSQPTLYFTASGCLVKKVQSIQLREEDFLGQVFSNLHNQNILSVIVEGGAGIHTAFIKAGTWNEARIITGQTNINIEEPVFAPILEGSQPIKNVIIGTERIDYYNKI